jgi:NAD(P)-dependent dehydrogenase (short-subunit alcohol dehydrogenase family)
VCAFAGRRVIVTGAAGQIGAACVEAFQAAGARVAALDRLPPAVAGDVAAVTADLADAAELERAFADAEERLGGVDVLVQAAAVMGRAPFLELVAEDIDRVLAINVRAILLGARRAAASLVARGVRDGAIVNLCSVAGVVAQGGSVAYETSKGAVAAATRSLAVALAPHGIRVAGLAPGSMVKPQELPARDPDALDDYERRRIPLGRLGTAREMADAVLFLASPAASYITGSILYADGGHLSAW